MGLILYLLDIINFQVIPCQGTPFLDKIVQ